MKQPHLPQSYLDIWYEKLFSKLGASYTTILVANHGFPITFTMLSCASVSCIWNSMQ